jgi:hypothetical protein
MNCRPLQSQQSASSGLVGIGLSLQSDAFTWEGDMANTSRWGAPFGTLKVTYTVAIRKASANRSLLNRSNDRLAVSVDAAGQADMLGL